MDIKDMDPMRLAINRAAEHLSSALRAGRGAPVEPHALSARASELISVLSRAQEVAMALSEQIETAAGKHRLGSDDDRFARARRPGVGSLVKSRAKSPRRGWQGTRPGTPWATVKLTEQPGSAAALAP